MATGYYLTRDDELAYGEPSSVNGLQDTLSGRSANGPCVCYVIVNGMMYLDLQQSIKYSRGYADEDIVKESRQFQLGKDVPHLGGLELEIVNERRRLLREVMNPNGIDKRERKAPSAGIHRKA